jgi:hypothetical protein
VFTSRLRREYLVVVFGTSEKQKHNTRLKGRVFAFWGCDPLPMPFSLGIGWDAMGLTGTNIGVGEGRAQIGAKKSGDAG